MTHENQEAERIATEAGRRLLALRQHLESVGTSARETGDQGDRLAHEFIVGALSATFPGIPILSEEGADQLARLRSEQTWIVDPLDGTNEFSQVGRSDWAVHVALAVNGEPVVGAVALPARGITLSTAQNLTVPPRSEGPMRILVSRSRAPAVASCVAQKLSARLAPMGSAGAKVAAVVLGDADCYIHAGGQYEWDSAAPVAVALAAGFHASRLDGSPLRYNQENTYVPDLVICRPELASSVLRAIRECSG
jgi:3'(2'), 5'-bisphosphate nucleotidase